MYTTWSFDSFILMLFFTMIEMTKTDSNESVSELKVRSKYCLNRMREICGHLQTTPEQETGGSVTNG